MVWITMAMALWIAEMTAVGVHPTAPMQAMTMTQQAMTMTQQAMTMT